MTDILCNNCGIRNTDNERFKADNDELRQEVFGLTNRIVELEAFLDYLQDMSTKDPFNPTFHHMGQWRERMDAWKAQQKEE